jgi:hypothetical protein
MAFLALLGLFLLKHVLLVHVVDFGYSQSRSQRQRWWYLGLAMHGILEVSVSALIYLTVWTDLVFIALLLEMASIGMACLLERHSMYSNLIRNHVLGELLVVVVFLMGAGIATWG